MQLLQIKAESFVEDINNLLNSGEVPNMFPYDERTTISEIVSVTAAIITGKCLGHNAVVLHSTGT
jgi:dynein heavy chain